MADKEGVIKRIDEELKMFEESVPVAKRDDIFFNDLQVKTAFRNALYNTPLTERMAGLVEKLDNILDRMFDYWTKLDYETLNLERNDFYEVTHRFLEQLDYDDRNRQLYERASNEYAEFLENLKGKTPQQIIDVAYEVVMKADILSLLEYHDLDKKQINILLTMQNPLDCIYTEWQHSDYSYMDMLRDSMNSLIDTQEHELTIHNYHINGKPPAIMEDYYVEYENEEQEIHQEIEEELEQC